MIQDQLVDYISSQMKLGVSRDAIKTALVGAGWVAGDIDDTLKKIDGSGAGAAAVSAKPAQSASPAASITSSATSMKASEPQMIRVSDLVSNAPATSVSVKTTTTTSSAAGMGMGTGMAKTDIGKFAGKISGNSFEAASADMSGSSGGKKNLIIGIVGGVVILGLAGLSWYFYSGNASLSNQIASLTSDSATVKAQLTSLQSQMDASSTGFATQIATLTAANADLALNLSFYATPLGITSSTAAVPVSVTINSGLLLGGGKLPYTITTPRGAKVFVAAGTSAAVMGQLKTMVGHTIEAVGTYIVGSDEVTVNSVTDLTPTPAPPVAASSTPSTSTSTASSTPAK